MNKETYQKLGHSFDKVLLDKRATKEITSNTYLHLQKAHPVFLEKYNPTKQTLARTLSNIIYFTAFSLTRIAQSLFNTKLDYSAGGASKVDVLLVSHITNKNQLLSVEDPYFGNLATLLTTASLKTGTALINHTNISNKDASEIARITDAKFILSPTLKFKAELQLYLSQFRAYKGLKQIISPIIEIPSVLKKYALLYSFSPTTSNALRISHQISQLVQRLQPKVVITTYEGHAWERLTYSSAREVNANIVCMGYQHSAIFKHQYAVKRMLTPNLNPDLILTAGQISQQLLANESQLKGIEIVLLGSAKNTKPKTLPAILKHNCLVVPEGIVSECIELFKLSLEVARQDTKQTFIWRLHPLISFAQLKSSSKLFNNIPNNIILSTASFDTDICRCDSVLYKGSTAVINAINAGLKPIYYKSEKLSVDPIYQLKLGKFTVKNADELKNAMESNIDSLTKQSLQDFAQNFYWPYNIQQLTPYLKRNAQELN